MVKDLNMDIEIVGCPIVREADGLAKSSRNTYLSAEERQAALILSKSLAKGKALIEQGERDAAKVIKEITDTINSEPLAEIDYVKIVDALTMQCVEKIENEVLCAIAVRIGKTRLIDNFIF
jgi:pantoate--beta-alanine ligase